MPQPQRRIVQLLYVPESEDGFPNLYAVCDDGTAWYRIAGVSEDMPWIPVSGPPLDLEYAVNQTIVAQYRSCP